ncbi:MAG: DUF4097 family beta strand repeat-containing protein [Candidatus Neomarinimicrobiota bacterium]
MKNHKIIYGISIIFVLFSLALASKPLEKFEKTYKTGKTAILDVSNSSGDVSVKRGGNEVIVVGLIRAGHSWKMSAYKADEVAKYVKDNPPITHSGKKVTIKKIASEDSRVIYIDYEITVPRNTRVSISTGSGDLEVIDVYGPADLSTGSGDVFIQGVEKGAELSTGSGDITGKDLASDVSASTGSGDISMKFSEPADVRASTGSGDITLDNLEGSLVARTGSGNASISGTAADEWKVSTGSGDVDVTLSDKVGYNVSIKTNSGYIETEPPITVSGRIKRNEIKGKIRGGGELVSLSTGSGDITLK